MSKPKKLTEDEIKERLPALAGWTVRNGKLHRELKFSDFSQAFGFMATMAIVSEANDHHPEWFNVYSRVVIDLSTHEVGGISERDFKWAAEVNRRLP
jgi:4a-hydroxytetrahydrobiopterin dehydratase